jgi:hypothetical protein
MGDNSGMNYTWPKGTIFIAITSKDLKVNPCFWAESQSSCTDYIILLATIPNWVRVLTPDACRNQLSLHIKWHHLCPLFGLKCLFCLLELIFNKQAIMKQLLTRITFWSADCIWPKFCVVVNISCMRIFNLCPSLLLQNQPMDNYKCFWTYWQTTPTVILDNSLVYSRNLHITIHMCFNCVNAFHIYYDCFFWQWNILQNFAKSPHQQMFVIDVQHSTFLHLTFDVKICWEINVHD